MLCVMLVLSSMPTSVFAQEVPEAKPPAAFADVQAGDWFFEAVEYVSRLNLMYGTSEAEGSFSPASGLTRAMLVTVLHRHAGSPVVAPPAQPFADIRETDWFAAAVNWAAESGITVGTGENRFSPNLPVTANRRLCSSIGMCLKRKFHGWNRQMKKRLCRRGGRVRMGEGGGGLESAAWFVRWRPGESVFAQCADDPRRNRGGGASVRGTGRHVCGTD